MNDIITLVKIALERVYTNHYYLIENRVSERGIVFWFGIYFYEHLKGTEFYNLDLDVEYNRNLLGVKKTQHFEHGTYPDLILHRRGNNKFNTLIIEFKTWWDTSIDDDIVKLQDFTDPHGAYKYELGLSILIERKMPSGKIVKNGNVVGVLDE